VSSGSVRSGGSGGAQVNLGYGTNAWADSRRASSSVSQVTMPSLSLFFRFLFLSLSLSLLSCPLRSLRRSRNFFLGHTVTVHAPVVLRVFRNFSPEQRKCATGMLSIFMTQWIYTRATRATRAVYTRGCNLSFIIRCGNYNEARQLQAETIKILFLFVGSTLTRQLS